MITLLPILLLLAQEPQAPKNGQVTNADILKPDPGCPAAVPTGSFLGCFYTGTAFDAYVTSRFDPVVSLTQPAPLAEGMPLEKVSARWTGDFILPAGTYRFTTTSDDGLRLTVDGLRVLDRWVDRGAATDTTDIPLTQGVHRITVEFYQNLGDWALNVSWRLLPPPPPLELCGDKVDNNGDGVIDEGCPVEPPPLTEICGDKIDNDNDGVIDEGCPVVPPPDTPPSGSLDDVTVEADYPEVRQVNDDGTVLQLNGYRLFVYAQSDVEQTQLEIGSGLGTLTSVYIQTSDVLPSPNSGKGTFRVDAAALPLVGVWYRIALQYRAQVVDTTPLVTLYSAQILAEGRVRRLADGKTEVILK